MRARPLAVVIGRDQARWLRPCLISLSQSGVRDVLYIDVASRDASASIARSFLQRDSVLPLGRNYGWGRAANVALKFAEDRGHTHVMYLNADTWVPPGSLEGLVECLASEPRVAILGPLQLSYPLPGALGATPNRWTNDYLAPATADSAVRLVDVEYVQGAALLTRVDMLRALGGFSEIYHTYSEDKDLARRARRVGMRIALTSEICLYHHYTDLEINPFIRGTRKYASGVLFHLTDDSHPWNVRINNAARYLAATHRRRGARDSAAILAAMALVAYRVAFLSRRGDCARTNLESVERILAAALSPQSLLQ